MSEPLRGWSRRDLTLYKKRVDCLMTERGGFVSKHWETRSCPAVMGATNRASQPGP